jgi:hypothetical protein
MKTAYIDGDILCYKAGFACQKTELKVKKGKRVLGSWKNKTEAQESLGVKSLEDYEVETIVTPEPISFCLRTVKLMIRRWCIGAGCERYKIYLDGQGNFRAEIATILPYKGNRTSAKPIHYPAIREYLIKHHNATLVNLIENDDMLSIVQYQEFIRTNNPNKIIVTTDKDAKNTPGWLFNPDKDETPQFISELNANRNFFGQLITGDKVDNIQGIPGKGDKSELFKRVKTLNEPREMYEAVLKGYEDAGFSLTELQENAKLLWMLRFKPKSKDELYTPWVFEDHFK